MIKIKLVSWPSLEIERLWRRWRGDCEDEYQSNCSQIDNGDDPEKIKFKQSLYSRKTIKESYFMDKKGPFRGKCVYCEIFISDSQRGDVEHFRPKGAVTDASDQPVYVQDKNGVEKKHWGYYWLAYELSNLMPACQLCNQPSSGNLGKRTRFPLENETARALYHSDSWDAEKPLLINPLDENDDPAEHLDVDVDTAMMIPKTDRGRACIDIFGLNKRDQLVVSRRNAISTIRFCWQDPKQHRDLLIQILVDATEAHTLASRSAYKELHDYLPNIDY
jgi:hypothetical protein